MLCLDGLTDSGSAVGALLRTLQIFRLTRGLQPAHGRALSSWLPSGPSSASSVHPPDWRCHQRVIALATLAVAAHADGEEMPPPSGGVPELPSAMRAYFPRHKRLILPIKVVLACSASPRCPGSDPSHLPAAQPLACRPAPLDRRKRKSRHERGPIVCSGTREQR